MFSNVLKDQIEILRRQLKKSFKSSTTFSYPAEYQSGPNHTGPSPPASNQRNIRALLDTLSDCATRNAIDATQPRIYESGRQLPETDNGSNRDIHALLDAMSDSLTSSDLRVYESAPPHPRHERDSGSGNGNEEGRNFRALLGRMTTTTQKNREILMDRFYHPPPKEYNPSTSGQGCRHPGAPTPSSEPILSSGPTVGANLA